MAMQFEALLKRSFCYELFSGNFFSKFMLVAASEKLKSKASLSKIWIHLTIRRGVKIRRRHLHVLYRTDALKKIENVQEKCRNPASVTLICDFIAMELYQGYLSITFFFKKVKTFFRESRGGSRTAATSKMERFVIIVGSWKPLTIITKHFILVIAAALHPPVVSYLTKYFWLFVKSVYLFSESNTYIVSIRLHKGNYRNRNIHRELFHKKSASKNFANLMGKNLWWSPFLVKLYPATFLRRLASQVFSYNFCKVLYITSGQHFLNK